MKTKKLLLSSFLFALVGCNKLTPAGFWKSFDSGHIVESISDQGPWGGHRAIFWQNQIEKYQEKDMLKFASHNGWKLFGRDSISANSMRSWVFNNRPIFPLDNSGFHKSPDNYGDGFQRWIKNGSILYKFTSGWTIVDDGIDKDAYGYVLINLDDTEMSVYHLWGE